MKVLPPGVALKTGLQEIGDRLTKEWLMRAGADGLAILVPGGNVVGWRHDCRIGEMTAPR
jgi:hypothetical protein